LNWDAALRVSSALPESPRRKKKTPQALGTGESKKNCLAVIYTPSCRRTPREVDDIGTGKETKSRLMEAMSYSGLAQRHYAI